MSLADDGFRLVYRDGAIRWVHPTELQPTDIDTTDMNDDEFARFIAGTPLATLSA